MRAFGTKNITKNTSFIWEAICIYIEREIPLVIIVYRETNFKFGDCERFCIA